MKNNYKQIRDGIENSKCLMLKLAWDQGIIQGDFIAEGADRNKIKRPLKSYAKK